MRTEIKELMDLLGVGALLSPYENVLWSVYDDQTSNTCTAEVRMGPDGDDLEAELQMLYETPPEGKSHLDQCFIGQFKPATGSQTKWDTVIIRAMGETSDNEEEAYNWNQKACNFFASCVQDLKMDIMPDIEEIFEREMKNKDRFSDRLGGGGGKSPKIKPQQLLGMKQGR